MTGWMAAAVVTLMIRMCFSVYTMLSESCQRMVIVGYRANETRQFARMLGLEPKNTAVRSPESNGIAESFVKTIKRDYISIMPKPDGLTAAKNLAEAFEHYNEWHPHSALGYRSPREYLRQRACNGLSDNRCLEI
ncbi:integrase core domain-containing protein [Escherichia coli]|uniref:integrase core domain-containing protein n=1 Tax=Escherichia coli TaxID=562 RepID=UPI0024C46AE5|nr:integrase core domain-containing protein [Escherichia coli]